MKAILDHIGIAVKDLESTLAFYRDALGLEIEAPEEVPVAAGARALRPGRRGAARTARSDRSRIADGEVRRQARTRHSITSRCASTIIRAALAQLKARGARLIDDDTAGQAPKDR